MEFHDASNLFPMMIGDDYLALRNDIKANGLLEPIVLCDGKILDGRNRYTVCLDLKIEPKYEAFNGSDPMAYVISKNLHRRHLNTSQRAMIAASIANMRPGEQEVNASIDAFISQLDAAEMLNVSRPSVQRAKQVIDNAPDLAKLVMSGEMSVNDAEKRVRERERNKERLKLADSAKTIALDARWNVCQGDINNWQTDKKYDFIITDPPYPREYLSLYDVLARRCKEWLKPNGLLIAMCGQSYLNEIIAIMDKHLVYYWTAAYLLPGQPTPLRQRQVNTSWKPLLIYSFGEYSGKIFGDVFKSDASDKGFHEWGQSISGMYSIISQICLPGQMILDPFCGAGTTGIAALKHGCLFDGIDVDESNVNISIARLGRFISDD